MNSAAGQSPGEQAALLRTLDPRVKARVWKIAPDEWHKRFLVGVFAGVPPFLAQRFIAEYETRLRTQGRTKANRYAFDLRDELLPELLPESGLAFDATDDEIADAAARAARHVKGLHAEDLPEAELLRRLGRMARRYRIDTPPCKGASGIVARMREAAWWRRALRKRFQRVEHAAIVAGCVHRHAAPYVSDEALQRFERHGKRIADLLAALEAMNLTTGEIAPLAELAENSLSNPANRRAAMMVCVRGLEDYATARGFAGLFLTITCPSRMHARYEQSGEPVPAYDPAISPRHAQGYLRRLWNRATRKLAREGIAYFGMRTVEPHHDATPHWHMVAFVQADQAERFTEILREHALCDSPDEHGAAKRRFVVKKIRPEKGGAVAYIAAYVAKNTDGFGVSGDEESGRPAPEGARRAVAWSRLWNVRQFQFFGAGAITPYRELYRVERIPDALDALLGDVWRAVKARDYRGFLTARDARGLRLGVLYDSLPSTRYHGEQAKRLRGVVCHADAGPLPIVTRPDRWVVQFRPEKQRVERRDSACSTRKTRSLGPDSITPRGLDRQGLFRVSGVSRGPPNRGSDAPRAGRHHQADRTRRREQERPAESGGEAPRVATADRPGA